MGTLIKATDWADPRFNQILRELKLGLCHHHRKNWEFAVIVRALEDAGMMDGGKRGLGLGTGSEVLCFHFANRTAGVVATDLFSADTRWENARYAVEDAYGRSPFPYARERLQLKNMDMSKIDLPDRSVDFVWSTSSVEHVSSVDAYLETFRGIDRVLVPGGVAAIVTEFNLRPSTDYRGGLILVDAPLIRRVEEATALRLPGGLDLTVEDHPYNVPLNLDALELVPFFMHLPNLWAEMQGALFTSALLLYRKDPALPRISGEERVDPALVEKYERIGQALKRRQLLEIRPQDRFTQAGVPRAVDGMPALESDGRRGYLTFGPYVQLPAGRYRAQVRLRAKALSARGPVAQVRQLVRRLECEADVALSSADPARAGQLTIAARSRVPLGDKDELIVELPFQTDGAARCEFRVRAPGVQGLQYLGTLLQPM